LRSEADFAPSTAGGFQQGIVVVLGAVGPVVAFEVVPQVFDWIQFGCVRWQLQQRDIVRHLKLVGAVVARSIPDQHGLHLGRQGLGELLQKTVEHRCVQVGGDDRFGLPGGRTGCTDHIDVLILRLSHGAGPRPFRRPDACQGALLTKPRFILKEDLDLSIGMLLTNLRDPLGKLFLNSSWAAGSAWRCWGRGAKHEYPSLCNK
jgi:hypothetical protein